MICFIVRAGFEASCSMERCRPCSTVRFAPIVAELELVQVGLQVARVVAGKSVGRDIGAWRDAELSEALDRSFIVVISVPAARARRALPTRAYSDIWHRPGLWG